MRGRYVAPVLLLCAGCASFATGGKDSVVIDSEPSGARVEVQDEDGEVVAGGTTPITVTLERGAGFFDGAEYTITCDLEDGRSAGAVLDTGIEGWYWGNVLLMGVGVIGFLAVDPATGAMWEFDEDRVVVMLPEHAGPVEPPPPDADDAAKEPQEPLDKNARIRQLLERLKSGELTPDEFEQEKNRVLGGE